MPIRAGVDASLRLPPRQSALVSAQPIAAIGRFIKKLKSGPVGSAGAATGGASDAAFIAMSTAASVATVPELSTATTCQEATPATDSPCATSLNAATTPGASSSPSIRVSTEQSAQDAPVQLSTDEGMSTNRLYQEMLGTGAGVAGGRAVSFDSYIATEPLSPPAINFTPIYPWNTGFAFSFVGDPSPFYVVPSDIRFLDFVTTGDDKKKFDFDKDIDRVITNGGGGATQLAATSTPEPATLTLLGTGLAAVGALRRRRKKSATD